MSAWILAALVFCLSAVVSAYVSLARTAYDLVVNDQPVGTSIVVERLVLEKGGYLAITPLSGPNTQQSVSDYMPAGVFTDFNVDIYWGDELDLPAQTPVVVRILVDNGDVYFDSEFDVPARNAQGQMYEKTIVLR